MTSTTPRLVARATTTTTESTDTITTLAMSSIFTPPASCSSSWTYEPYAANLVENGLLLQNAVASDGADPDCFPSGYSQYGRISPTIVYSPGYCPSGYTSANLVIHSSATTAECCLSDFTYYTESRAGTTTYAGCISNFPSTSSTIVTVRQVSGESTQVTGPITMWAQPIQVELEASDSSLFVTATTTSNTTTLATSTQTSTTSAQSATSTASTGTETSGLSTGAKIGVGVGVGAAGLVLILALVFWFYRRRQAKAQQVATSGGPEPSELGGSNTNPSYHAVPSELGSSSQADTSSVANTRATAPSELQAGNPDPKFVHELGA
ncbi:unnamed protein product [Penicillium glandicola]